MKATHKPHKLVFLAVAILLATVSFGCFDSSTDVESEETAVSAAVVSMSQIRESVDMTDAQASVVSSALADWRNSSSGDGAPVMQFLASSAQALNREQLKSLIGVLADNPPRGEGRGQRGRNRAGNRGKGMGPFAELDLSEVQKEQLQAARKEMRDAGRALHESVRAGEITREEAREARRQLHEGFKETMKEILTDEQEAQLEDHMTAKMIERLSDKIARLESGDHPKLELLAKLLDLSDEQVSNIESVIAATIPQLKEVLAGLEDDSIDPQTARETLESIREDSRAAITDVLTDDQLELFEELARLRPHRRHHGPGHGPR